MPSQWSMGSPRPHLPVYETTRSLVCLVAVISKLTILLAIDSDFIKGNAQPDQNLLVSTFCGTLNGLLASAVEN